jgi:DNA-binding NarL/FixJ family response regulator
MVARHGGADTGAMVTNRSKVYIVDDSPAMRVRFAEILDEIGNVDVVGEAGRPDEAIAGILDAHPACVLLDYQLEGGTGLDVLRAVHPRAPDVVFVVLTNHATPPYRRACLDAGARYFLDKSSDFGQIKDVIEGLESAQSH